jgi:hypothetical protein
MDILTKINTLPNEIQNLIFYYCIQTEANLIKNIDWKKEYKNTFFKMNFYNFGKNNNYIQNRNIFGDQTRKYHHTPPEIYIYQKNRTNIFDYVGRISMVNLRFTKYADKNDLVKACIDNGITKFNKNDRISMIKKLMKI